ncbi:EAL domain-containing protein [Cohaesibacter sp. CAU 1516]|nr:EAL domain-containing protein [Cohaesibacter sp. CAU 1516]
MNPLHYRPVQDYWPVFGALIFLIAMTVVASHINETHKSMLSLADQSFLTSAQKKVQDVELHFDRLKQTGERIAASHSVESYITGKKSEDGTEQVLSKRIDEIEQRFNRFLRNSNSLEYNVFSYLAFIDRDGTLIASSGHAQSRKTCGEATSKFEAKVSLDFEHRFVVATAPVYHRAAYQGCILTLSAFDEVLDLLQPSLSEPDIFAHLVMDDGQLIIGSDEVAASHGVHLNADILTAHSKKTVLHDLQLAEGRGKMVGVSVPLRNMAASMHMLQPASGFAGGALSDNFALPLLGFSCFMLIFTIGINHLRIKNNRLKTEFGIIREQSRLLARKNNKLSREIERRKSAEADSREKALELESLNTDLQIAATAFESIEGMAVIDTKKTILKVNSALLDMLQTDEATLLNRPILDLLDYTLELENAFSEVWETLEARQGWQREVQVRNKSGDKIERWMAVSPVLNKHGNPTHYILTFYDLSAQKQAEDRVRQLAFHDQLTDLPNRSLLIDRLQLAMKANALKGTYSAVMFLDLDNFKTLNDTLGHDAGDELLIAAARRLQASVGKEQTVARFGGDEFVILMPKLNGQTAKEAALDAEIFSFSILDAFEQPFQLAGVAHRCTTSIGIATFGPEVKTYEDILKHADIAMYQAKRDGRNAVRFYDPALQENLSHRMRLERDLRTAVKQQELTLFYQPQVSFQGAVTGAEALLRWKHPELGYVSPAEFIPIAESCGLIPELGNWILDTACQHLAEWQNNPDLRDLTLSVNVSAIQLHHFNFVDQVLTRLAKHKAPATKLKLEITESHLVDNVEDAITKMEQLRQQGVRFALDDFGTGYSSLSYLKKLPLDQLKIDQSFVRSLPCEPNDAAIAKMIVALSETLELSVIAEGVETEEQRDFLHSVGCDDYQGFFFAKPLPHDEYVEFASLFSGKSPHQTDSANRAAS